MVDRDDLSALGLSPNAFAQERRIVGFRRLATGNLGQVINMMNVARITLHQVLYQAYAYVHAHITMLSKPVEFGKTIVPGDTDQYFRSYKHLGISAALVFISLKIYLTHQPLTHQPPPQSVTFVVFGIFIWVLLYGILLAIFFKYCGIEAHSWQTAVAFWLNWWSCMGIMFYGGLFLITFINPDKDKTAALLFAIAFLFAFVYVFIFVPCKWIKGMVLNSKLRRGTGESYFFMIGVFLLFSGGIHPNLRVRDYLAPVFDYLP